MKTIYFDNAATSHYKPKCVQRALVKTLKNSANPGRSGHKLSLINAIGVFGARQIVAKHFGIKNAEGVIFTKNCTEAINIAVLGLTKNKCHVICSQFDHNAILRPLNELKIQNRIDLDIVSGKNKITKNDIEKALKPNTKLVCIGTVSNVTGYENDIEEIGLLCHKKGILLLVDDAQGAGHTKIDMTKSHIEYLAFSGHKGFLAPQGIGALCINTPITPCPTICGGTGTDSYSLNQPKYLPESLESGTLATPLILSLKAGIEYVERHFDKSNKKLQALTLYLHDKLKNIKGIKIYSWSENKVGIASFTIKGFDSAQICDYLDNKYNIAARGGLHCAPLTHEYYHTLKEGMVRVSLSNKNTKKQINKLIYALMRL